MKKTILLIFITLLGCNSIRPGKISPRRWEAMKKKYPYCRFANIDRFFPSYSYLLKPRTYQVIKIDSLKYNYIYYLYDNKDIFKTVGLRDLECTCNKYVKKIENCKTTLQVGKKYDLTLHLISNPYSHVGLAGGFKYESIKIERDSIIGGVFQSPQIQGKCYVKPSVSIPSIPVQARNKRKKLSKKLVSACNGLGQFNSKNDSV